MSAIKSTIVIHKTIKNSFENLYHRDTTSDGPSGCVAFFFFLEKMNHRFSKYLDFIMLLRIKTKSNLIAPCFKKCVNETTFRQRLHPRMAVYFEDTFRRIERYIILYVFNIVSIIFSVLVL